ncbi:biotin--[acetyl-CoA-carboxylase] ligase [Camelliibacillus cellulosilyticus]|uniref:Bifunctional ligase/repressor BirA n=1 Tax=Camelliibacillus cellulosilyticus TaxID=2174486 RepID=A0ABV9GM65_9BACL
MSRTKDAILTMLFANRRQFLSGQTISDQLGCSRTAVWKHIKELEKEGYVIESVQKRGYRLALSPDRLSAPEITAGLETERFGRTIVYEPSMSSTQKVAHHLAEDGAEEGTLIVTDEQTEGRGRLGRHWDSGANRGIWMSLILRPSLQLKKIPPLTLLAAVAVVKAINKVTQTACAIKWPNDILYDGKKLVGILTEMQAEEQTARAVILGIGMNVNTRIEQFPENLRSVATSLYEITGKDQSRVQLIQSILKELEDLYHLYLTNGFAPIKLMWESYALCLGRVIHARTVQGDVIKGMAKGISEEGVLLLEDANGEIHSIYSADIQFDSPNPS